MARDTRSPDDVRAASAHLHYEIDMFEQTAELLLAQTFEPGVVRNALLESFAVHARALVLFFFPPSEPDRRDVTVFHYVDRDVWPSSAGTTPPTALQIKGRVGTEIAHLSYGRIAKGAPSEWDWDVAAIRAAMRPLFDMFYAFAPAELLSEHWHTRREAAPPQPLPWQTAINTKGTAGQHIVSGVMVNTISANTTIRG